MFGKLSLASQELSISVLVLLMRFEISPSEQLEVKVNVEAVETGSL